MALKAILEDLDSVDEQFHSLYQEQDGQYVLQIDGLEAHPGAQSLKNALDRVRREKREAANKVSEYEERLAGVPEEFNHEAYEELLAKAEKAGSGGEPNKDLEDRLERQRASYEKKLESETTKRDQKIQQLDSQLRRVMIDDGLTQSLISAGISKEYLPAAKALLKEKGSIQLVEEDNGQFQVFADDGVDDRTPLAKFVQGWAGTDEGKPFVAKATGGGSKGGEGERFANNPFDKDTKNLTAQQSLIAENPEKARQMAKAAGVNPTW